MGKATLTVKSKPKKGKKAKTETIGTVSFSIPAGATKPLRVKLNAVGSTLLRSAHGHLSAYLKVVKESPGPSKTQFRERAPRPAEGRVEEVAGQRR